MADVNPIGNIPPKVNPLAKPVSTRPATLKLKPILRKPGEPATAAPAPVPASAEKSPKGITAPIAAEAILKKEGMLAGATAAQIQASKARTAKISMSDIAPEVAPAAPAPVADAAPAAEKPIEQLKNMTQKLKGITQEIPQQAILKKTGIVSDQAATEAQKQAAKARTARISLSDAIGVAPVSEPSAAPLKTIRIRRPGATGATIAPAAPAAPAPAPAPAAPQSAEVAPVEEKPAESAVASSATVTQRKTLKIQRPGAGGVRPSGKFAIKRPSSPTAVTVKKTVVNGPSSGAAPADGAPADGEVADIPEMPAANSAISAYAPPPDSKYMPDVPKGVAISGLILQIAACIVVGALGYFLYESFDLPLFCGGCR